MTYESVLYDSNEFIGAICSWQFGLGRDRLLQGHLRLTAAALKKLFPWLFSSLVNDSAYCLQLTADQRLLICHVWSFPASPPTVKPCPCGPCCEHDFNKPPLHPWTMNFMVEAIMNIMDDAVMNNIVVVDCCVFVVFVCFLFCMFGSLWPQN